MGGAAAAPDEQEGPVISDEAEAPSVPPADTPVDVDAAPVTVVTADGAPAEPPAEAPTPASPAVRRRRKRWLILGLSVGLVSAVLIAASLIPVPYYTIAPGSVRTTEPRIKVDGTAAFDHPGDVSFTTISFAPATVLTAVLGWLDPSVEVLDEKTALGGQQPDENRKRNLELMDSSKQAAQVVALRKLGYQVGASGTGAVIAFTKPGTPAASVLEVGDVVTAVDGTPIGLSDELVAAIGARQPGDKVALTVEPAAGGAPETRTVELIARDDGSGKAMLGVQAGTRNITFDLPFSVTIDSGDVGGPSAGLAFTLGTIDKLTPGGITGGKQIATTGTIDLAGRVGPVGGVPQKTVAVRRSGAAAFLVPRDEYEDAKRFAGDMPVIPVDTLDDALAALGSLGGDTANLAQAPAQPAG
ncbi:MAG: S16 family serine protease [Acidimicrobiales bacterium]